jgi:hypothetical protein
MEAEAGKREFGGLVERYGASMALTYVRVR